MTMLTIGNLKSPDLVFKVQQFFGLKELQNEENKKDVIRNYEIGSKFWHYLFLFGTELGDELFYSTFIPFWFWNIDGYVGRRVILVWAIIMYIGQAIKDILQWSRPGYPVIRLQKKWSLEYGMPSTHAMVGVSIPFSILLYTMSRYQYEWGYYLLFSIIWCLIICFSRIYLGMHTVLDVVFGLGLAVVLMFPLVPLVEFLDSYLLTNPSSPFLLMVASLVMIVYYPNSTKWTPTRGDTCMILGVTVGVHIGAWLNYQTGVMSTAELSPPYAIYWPSYYMLGCAILRTILGLTSILITKEYGSHVAYSMICAALGKETNAIKNSKNTLENKHKLIVELGHKYIICAVIGFNILYTMPHAFRFLHIERPTFYTEI